VRQIGCFGIKVSDGGNIGYTKLNGMGMGKGAFK